MIKLIPTIIHNFKDPDEDIDQSTQDFESTWFWFLESCMFTDDEYYGLHYDLIKKIDYTKSHKLQNKLLNLIEKITGMNCIDRHSVFYKE